MDLQKQRWQYIFQSCRTALLQGEIMQKPKNYLEKSLCKMKPKTSENNVVSIPFIPN